MLLAMLTMRKVREKGTDLFLDINDEKNITTLSSNPGQEPALDDCYSMITA